MWDAACATADPDLFFPRQRRDPQIGAAKGVCAYCPVKDECLQKPLLTWVRAPAGEEASTSALATAPDVEAYCSRRIRG
jgi:hypothetical protein